MFEHELTRTEADTNDVWLTVSEAVTHCASRGLSRTPKTVRRWAHRSAKDPDLGDLVVRSQDLETGFRWTIELNSLDRKIDQELEFELRKPGGQERTGLDQSALVQAEIGEQNEAGSSVKLNEHGQTRSVKVAPDSDLEAVNQELRDRIQDLKSQVDFYEEEFRDRRQTTRALTDVIAAFRLNAESQANQSRPSDGFSSTVPKAEQPDDGKREPAVTDGSIQTPPTVRRLSVNPATEAAEPERSEHNSHNVL